VTYPAFRAGVIGLLAGLLISVTPPALPAQGTVALPGDVKITPPDPATPKELAAFSGRWSGTWGVPGSRAGAREVILVFERIEINPARATVVYGWGPRPENAQVPERSHLTAPGWRRLSGPFVDGAFHLTLDNTVRVFRLGPGDTLAGSWTQGRLTDRATLHRLPE
jgi:hypothetical protein